MTILFTVSIITSIIVLGITIVTQEGMALYRIREWAESKNSSIFQPLILCHWCMPSVYSALGFIFALKVGALTKLSIVVIVWNYPLVVCLSSIICGLIWSLYLLIDSAREHYQNTK